MEHLKQQSTSKRKLKLGDIAEHLQVKKFVVRTWEKELGLEPQSGGYDADGVELFKKIKQLVVEERQSLDQVRQVIGASKISSTIQPAILELENPIAESLETAPVEELSYSSNDCVIESAYTNENTPNIAEQEYVPAEILQAAPQEETSFLAHSTPIKNQQFFSELELFKQELIRLQELLKA